MTQSTPLRPDTVIFMGGITALTAVSVDIVLPATAVVARDFGKPEHLGALLVGVYFIAYAFGQIFWGLFSDAYGRRLGLKVCLSLFTIASIACALAPTFELLITARIAQGLTGGTPVIARAMVRDVASGSEAGRLMTLLGAILSLAAMIAPVLGSGLLLLFGWRALFVFLTLLAMSFLLFTVFVLQDVGSNKRPERFSFRFLLSEGRSLIGNCKFFVPMAAGALTFGGFASLSAVGAITAETVFGVAPEACGALFTIAALVNVGSALFAGQLLKYLSLKQVGTIAMSLVALAAAVNVFTALSTPSLVGFWATICLYVLAFGVTFPTALTSAMEPAGDVPGFAASLAGASQMILASVGAFVATSLFDGSHTAINWTMASFGILAVLTVIIGRTTEKS